MKTLINISFGLFLRWNDGFVFLVEYAFPELWSRVHMRQVFSVSRRVSLMSRQHRAANPTHGRQGVLQPTDQHRVTKITSSSSSLFMSAVTSSLAKWRSKERKWHVLDERQTSAANPDALLCNSWSKFYMYCKIVGDIARLHLTVITRSYWPTPTLAPILVVLLVLCRTVHPHWFMYQC